MNENVLFSEEYNLEENSLQDTSEVDSGVDTVPALRSISGGAYQGSISTTYIEYFNGFIDDLPPGIGYLIYRPSQYEYRLVYSTEVGGLNVTNGTFSSDSVNYVNVYSDYNSYQITTGTDSLNVSVGSAMVYSNLPGYSRSLKGVNHVEGLALICLIGFLCVHRVIQSFFSSR